ncbi:MAG: hypothetical protein L6R38_001007 [Xanthoria sp. 2 TBL-2021]|nr:MAG: hypothetical protein L6R38_001007 [Xanthoria sp. 2 TBL-2021]
MPLHQRTAFPASHSTSSLPESSRPPVPPFPDTTDTSTEQPLDMTNFSNMHGSSPRGSLSSSMLTSIDSLFSSTTWPPASNPDPVYDERGYPTGEVGTYLPMSLLRGNSTSSADTPQTVSPDQLQINGPPSGFLGFDSTPLTNYTDSPVGYSGTFSNQTSPENFYQDSPYINDGVNLDQQEFGPMMMFPEMGPTGPMEGPTSQQEVIPKLFQKGTVAVARAKSTPGKSPRSPRSTVVDGRVRKPPRTKPLRDICPDPNDPKKMKTARNTAAARKSRARKVERFQTLAEENDNYKVQVEELQSEADIWKARALRMGWVPGPE